MLAVTPDHTVLRGAVDVAAIRDALLEHEAALPFSVLLSDPWGSHAVLGDSEPLLTVTIRSSAGASAVRAMGQVALAEAYINGDIDLDGDLIRAMELRVMIRRDGLPSRVWSVVEPMLHGRARHNPRAIAKHYDMHNVQLLATENRFQLYTPGIYVSVDDTLETGGARRLATVYEELCLGTGKSLLDVGCGWGGFVRYACARGVDATGISLSQQQVDYARDALKADKLSARIEYADFFSYEPSRTFDAISLMGVMEDLSDYQPVLNRVSGWLAPGGCIYMDFAAVARRFQISGFIARNVWPGGFRMVKMPQFVVAVDQSPLELVSVSNDRENYYTFTKLGYERWSASHAQVCAIADERTYRLLRLLYASIAFIMGPRSSRATAYRVLLRRRAAGGRLGELLPGGQSEKPRARTGRISAYARRLR